MYFLELITSGQILAAMAVYGVLAALEPFLEAWLEHAFDDNPPALWSWAHVGVPLLRAALVLGFVFMSYPALFGLREGPPLATLLAAHDSGPSVVLGVLFLVALFSPILPIFHRHPEFVLPVQGVLATAFLFNWLTDYLHMTTVSVWPGFEIAIAILGSAYLMHRLARRIGYHFGAAIDSGRGTRGFDVLLIHVVTMLAQLPVVLIYSVGLSQQIAI